MRRNGFVAAWAFFTIMPAPMLTDVDRKLGIKAIRAVPWIGLVLGVMAGLVAWLITLAGAGQPLAIAAGLAVLAAATGFFHLDGLADTADGLGSRKPADQALQIMHQSDIGPMGVCSIILVLALEIAAASSPHLAGSRGVWALATMPMVARLSTVMATRHGVPCAPTSNLGKLYAGGTTTLTLVVNTIAVGAVAVASGWLLYGTRTGIVSLVAFMIASIGAYLWQRHLVRRLGGLTGDTYGSLIELTGLVYFLVLALGA